MDQDNKIVLCDRCLGNRLRQPLSTESGFRQTFVFTVQDFGSYVWDIEKAIVCVNTPMPSGSLRNGMLLDRDQMALLLQNAELHDEHVGHVDLDYPGIMSFAWDPVQQAAAAVLIDGTHRLARAYREGRTEFRSYVLSYPESVLCLIGSPQHTEFQICSLKNMHSALETIKG